MGNFQKTLSCQCYQGNPDLPMLSGSVTGPWLTPLARTCRQSKLHQICTERRNRFACIHPVSDNFWCVGLCWALAVALIRLSAKSIVNIASLPFLDREGRTVYISLVTMAKEVAWLTRLKELKMGTFFPGESLINCFRFHLKWWIRVKREVFSFCKFIEKWMRACSEHAHLCRVRERRSPFLTGQGNLDFVWGW